MNIINPFEEIVVFGKKLPLEPMSSTRIRALKPTGKHLGHGLDLTHVRGRASGGRATKLERYTTTPKGLRQGPFSGSSLKNGSKLVEVKGSGKGYRTGPFGKSVFTQAPEVARILAQKPGKPSTSRGLGMIAGIPKSTLKPTGAHLKGLKGALDKAKNSNIPNGARKGGRL